MKIFTFCVAPWDDTNSFGNTVSNWFCGETWDSDTFSNFYCRSQLPDNKKQVDYYCLTSVDIIKGFFKGKIQGKTFTSDAIADMRSDQARETEIEKSRINKIHSKKSHWIYVLNEWLWMSRIWLNKSFKAFVQKNDPDIFFAFAYEPFSLWPIISYLKKHTKCKIVLFIADDVKGFHNQFGWIRKGYLNRRLRHCIESADKLYAVSDEMSKLYSDSFHCDISTLYKGCDLTLSPRMTLNHPLRIVYAGNLLWGRDDTLSLLAKVLEKQNANGTKAVLEIYSSTVAPELDKKLNIPGSSQLMGPRSYDEIKQIMHNADIVLYVESFVPESIELVRYSFSTKIIDCLQSGSQVLGIGPAGIASMNYLRKVDGVIVVDDMEAVESEVEKLISNSDRIFENVIATRKYAVSYHEIDTVQAKLKNDFQGLCQA